MHRSSRLVIASLFATLLAAPAIASADPRVVVATDPIALIHSHYTLSASVALGDHVAARGDVVFGTKPEPTPDGHQLAEGSVSLQLFLDRTFHGPFLEPGLVVRRMPAFEGELGGLDQEITDHYHVEPELLVGWQWLYHDRFSLAVAAGAVATPPPGWPSPGYATETYLRMGYAF